MVTAYAAGNSSDPLITRSHLEGAYRNTLNSSINTTVSGAATAPTARLNTIQNQVTTFHYADKFTPISLSRSDSVVLNQGSSFTLRSGTATLEIARGTVINVTTGAAVTTGAQLVRNQRYFSTENTSVTIRATTALQGLIDGYYSRGSRFLPAPTTQVFTDIPSSHPSFTAINWGQVNGIMVGSGGRFHPDGAMTRGDFLLIMHRYHGSPSPANPGVAFSDIPSTSVYFAPAKWAQENGLILGSGGRFFPNDPLPRDQMATILYRYNVMVGGDTSARADALNQFSDRSLVPASVAEHMRWAVTHDLIRGSGGRIFSNDTTTRESAMAVLYRYFLKFDGSTISGPGTPPPPTQPPQTQPPPQQPPPPPAQSPFSDVSTTHPSYAAVAWAQSERIMVGSGGRFFPNDAMTRGDFVLILHRLAGSPAPARPGVAFSDVGASSVYYNPVKWAHENGIVLGSGGRFFPADTIPRNQMATILYRYNVLRGRDMTINSNILDQFTDRAQVPSSIIDHMRWAVTHDILQGSGGRINPNDITTREGACSVLYRYFLKFGR